MLKKNAENSNILQGNCIMLKIFGKYFQGKYLVAINKLNIENIKNNIYSFFNLSKFLNDIIENANKIKHGPISKTNSSFVNVTKRFFISNPLD